MQRFMVRAPIKHNNENGEIDMNSRLLKAIVMIALALWGLSNAFAGEAQLSANVDLVSRYNWRGLDFGDRFSVQPATKLEYRGFKCGFWGSYSDAFDEIDTWASYTASLGNGGNVTALAIDYYFPSAGIDFFNFNNHDDEDGAGAHTVEVGASWTGPEDVPLTLSGYINVYNDAGSNTYFQIDYATKVNDVGVGIWLGATGGSEENPAYYGARDFRIINLGVKVTRTLKLSAEAEFPLSVSFINNPNDEISYLIFGLSL